MSNLNLMRPEEWRRIGLRHEIEESPCDRGRTGGRPATPGDAHRDRTGVVIVLIVGLFVLAWMVLIRTTSRVGLPGDSPPAEHRRGRGARKSPIGGSVAPLGRLLPSRPLAPESPESPAATDVAGLDSP